MPVSLHKMLMHGSEVIEELCLPVGQTSKEGMEGKHKDIINTRLRHTCKISRQRINEDLLHGLLVSSDPMIGSYREMRNPKHQAMDPEVLALLRETGDDSNRDDDDCDHI